MSTVAGIYASIENGAKIVMQATETKKKMEIISEIFNPIKISKSKI